MAGSLVREDWADKCSLCFAGFACKLAVCFANGIKINVHSITLLCLCLNHVWTLHLWINQNIEVVFHRTQRGWKLKSCVEIKSMWSTAFETCNLSVVILLACCFNALFTGVNHKNYNFLACDWFKNVLFSTNSLSKLLSDSLLLDSLLLDSLLSDSLISQSHSKM